MDTAEILFLASDPREFKGTLPFWQDVRPISLPVHWARCGKRKGRPVIAVANGAGWHRSALGAQAAPHKLLCNIGFCGALDPALQIADIIVSSRHLPVRCERKHVTGPILSLQHIVGTAEAKHSLRGEGHLAVEMESAGIQSESFFCIKAVSDLADESFANNFGAALLPDGRISKFRIVAGALRRPFTRVPELIRIARHSAAASKELGEFLDACHF